MLAGVTFWGKRRLENDVLVRQGRPVRVALVQGNIPQDQKWDAAQAGKHSQDLSDHDARGGGQGGAAGHLAGVVHAVSVHGRSGRRRTNSRARRAKPASSCCSAAIRSIASESYYNAAFLVRKDGSVAGVYQKMHLVPFGEFVPLKHLLFFVGPLVEQAGGFTPGARDGDAADEPWTDQHGDLLRDRVSAAGARSRCCAAASC